nr:MAG TPA: hypothetical protein [Caudoviricetes sp.]
MNYHVKILQSNFIYRLNIKVDNLIINITV